jgi:hypothetical protein
MQIMINSLFIILIYNLSISGFAQDNVRNFEGEILFIKKTLNDTSYISYKIKDHKIRFEELDKNQKIENYFILDLFKRSVFAINPKRKIYADLPVYQWEDKPDTLNYKTQKTGNYKFIKGYKCFQWRVINDSANTEIQFWTISENFSFYSDFQKLLNSSDKFSQYYLNSPGIYGEMPLESVERSILREMRMQMEVVSIEQKKVQSYLFDIPKGYTLFQNK